MLIVLVFLGLTVGAATSLLGIGGGVLMAPFLPLLFGLSQHEAIGTSLFTIFIVTSMNTYSFNKKGLVPWNMVLVIGPFTGLASYFSGSFANVLPDKTLKLILAFTLFLFGLFIMLKKGNHQKTLGKNSTTPTDPPATKNANNSANANNTAAPSQTIEPSKSIAPKTKIPLIHRSIVGLSVGSLSGLTGLGSGIILSPFFLHFGWSSNEKISPTTNGIMIFTSFFGSLAYLTQSNDHAKNFQIGAVHLDYALVLMASALLSAHFLRPYQHKVPAKARKWILGTILCLLGLRIFLMVA